MNKKINVNKLFLKAFVICAVIGVISLIISLLLNNINNLVASITGSIFLLTIPSFFYYFSYVTLKYKETISLDHFIISIAVIGIPLYKLHKIAILLVPIAITYTLIGVNSKTLRGRKKFARRVGILALLLAIILTIMFIKSIDIGVLK